MKNIHKLLILICLCFTKCQAEEKLFFQLDPQEWKIGFQTSEQDQTTVEMIHHNEDINSWKELFTIQKFDNISASADQFINEMSKVIAPYTKEYDLHFKKIESPEFGLFELSFKPKDDTSKDLPEYNVGRVLNGKNAIYEIRYSHRDEAIYKAERSKWIEKLKNIYVGDEAKEGQWLIFTEEGIYDNHKALPYEVEKERIVDTKAGFSLALPNNWLIKDEWMNEKDFDEKHLYKIALIFTRPDFQIYGGVAFYDARQSEDAYDPIHRYLELYEEHNVESHLLSKGEIKTDSDIKGQYIQLKANHSVGWINFFEKGDRIFRLEIWTAEKQFNTVKDDMELIIKSFSFAD